MRAEDQDRRSHLPFVFRIARTPDARLVDVVRQRLYRHVRDSRQGQKVCPQGAVWTISRAFAPFSVFVVHLANVFFKDVREDLDDGLTSREQARADLTGLRGNVTSLYVLHSRHAGASAALQVTLKG